MKCKALAMAFLGGLLTGSTAVAQTAPHKVLRGLAGMTTAFLEVPGNMVAETKAHGPGEGLPLGFAKGLGMIVPRVLVGVWEFISAPFPLPSGYRPLLEPEFPWSYFDHASSESHPHPQRRRASRSPLPDSPAPTLPP